MGPALSTNRRRQLRLRTPTSNPGPNVQVLPQPQSQPFLSQEIRNEPSPTTLGTFQGQHVNHSQNTLQTDINVYHTEPYIQEDPGLGIVVALFEFKARTPTEISFKVDDRLKILRREDDDWLQAEHLHTKARGLIPVNYVAVDKSLDSFDWYLGELDRRTTESLLNRERQGTFLVRSSVRRPGDYVLSLKAFDPERGGHIKHYIIKAKDGNFSLLKQNRFPTLHSLIEEFKVRPHGLPSLLCCPCPKPMPELILSSEWEIDRSEVVLNEEIGHGNFGSVYKGVWRDTTEVAIKTLKTGKMSSEKFLEEAKIMKGLKHPNILSLLATCSKEDPIYIITEFMNRGSLLTLLKESKKTKSLSEDEMLGFSFQIAKGMEYLEQKKLVHRDLAARNVLVNAVPICKIADFGLAKIAEEDVNICKEKFPVKWSPPETFLRGEFSIKSDVWAFGVVVVEIFTYGDPVYTGMTTKEVQQNVKNGYRLPHPELMPEATYEVLRRCWDTNPEQRPDFNALVEFFDENRNKFVDGTMYLTEEAFSNLQR